MKINIKVKPASRSKEVKKINPDLFEVRVTSVPEKGKANKAIIELLAEYFKVPKSAITIIRGVSSRKKVIEIKTKPDFSI